MAVAVGSRQSAVGSLNRAATACCVLPAAEQAGALREEFMPEALLVQPDVTFIRDVMASGGEGLKKCYQCAACSAVCTLSPSDAPFPRKQIIKAQWGLKDKLVADPAIWLCHDCGDCTAQCPRDGRPSEILGAIRAQVIKHLTFPSLLGSWTANPRMLPLLFLLPVLVFAAIAYWSPVPSHPGGREFADVFPIGVLEPLFFMVAGFVLLAFGVGIARLIRASGGAGLGRTILLGLAPAAVEIATHKRFAQCGVQKRRTGHLLVFYGFGGLALVGTVVGMASMAGLLRTPLALDNPLKILANLSAVVALAGSTLLLLDRIRDPQKRKSSTWFDWFFPLALFGVVVTGIVSELLRLMQAAAMYWVYFVHLVLIFSLFISAPYSKFAHLTYRTVALALAANGTRETAGASVAPAAACAGDRL